jgi:polyisoprenoid-binding protein YceI
VCLGDAEASSPGIVFQVVAGMLISVSVTSHIRFPQWFIPGAIRDPGKESLRMVCSSSLHRQALAFIPPAVVAAGMLLSAASGVTAQESATPTPIGLIQEAENLPECAPAEIGALPEGTDAATVYAIVPEESTARYRVQEELAQVGETEAVGETQAIIGQFGFGEDELPLPCSRFDVDMRTLQSDQARRDNYLYQNTLEAETYPLATFVLRGIEGMDAPLADGQETTLRLIGDLTLRDVTKLVAWEANVTLVDGALTGAAATMFEMPDFGIEPPSVPVVLSLDETIRLEVDFTARPG